MVERRFPAVFACAKQTKYCKRKPRNRMFVSTERISINACSILTRLGIVFGDFQQAAEKRKKPDHSRVCAGVLWYTNGCYKG